MVTHEKLVDLIRQVKQFEKLPTSVLAYIIKSGNIRQFKKDETLFHESQPCAGLYVLIEGEVSLCKVGPEGQISLLNILYPVIMFNEVPALDGGTNAVSAIASSSVTTWTIGHNAFQHLIQEHHELGLSLLQILAKRNRLLIAHYDDLSFRTIEARLAKYIIELSEQGKNPIFRKTVPIKVIAARVVTSPEGVSRTLKHLKEIRLIECNRQMITILDLQGMIDRAQIPFY